jgi:phosphoglycerate kinase
MSKAVQQQKLEEKASAPKAPAKLVLRQRVSDIWPVHNKRFLLRVDFNVPIKNGVIRDDYRIRQALSTIHKIVDNGGICIVMSHLGRPKGHPWSEVRHDASRRKLIMTTWTDENGTQKTEYFSRLSNDNKRKILAWSSVHDLAQALVDDPQTGHCGRTVLFSRLKDEEKLHLLEKFRSETKTDTPWVHLHRYDNEWDLQLSLRPVAKRLEELLSAGGVKHKVEFAPDCLAAESYVKLLKPGDVLLLENVRFYSNESSHSADEQNEMARQLASYGDYYVCDAFGTAHRKAATITGIPKILGHGAAGDLMTREITQFATALNNPIKPFIAIVGGSKVSDKIAMLKHLLTQIDVLLIGGAMAYTFLRSQGIAIGKSFSETGTSFSDRYGKKQKRDMVAEAANLLELAKKHNVRVLLPVDHVCYTKVAAPPAGEKPTTTDGPNVPENMMALDIGPKTVAAYVAEIKKARTCIWNGPVGVFEISPYGAGTFAIATAVAQTTVTGHLLSIVGGGDTASAVDKAGVASHIWHVSTGGGAGLELMEGKQLPGIAALTPRRLVVSKL